MSIRVIEELTACDRPPDSREFRAALVGCGLSGAMIAALALEARLDLIDFDLVEPAQVILPPLTTPGRSKAALVREYRRARFPWLGHERALIGAAEALGDGYWRALADERGVLLACTDSVSTQIHLARVARRHGLPMVTTGLGPEAVEVLVAPAACGAACYGCLGRDAAEAPAGCFLDGIDATPANAPTPPPTNSSLHLAALAAATAIEEARALAGGAREHAEMLSLAPGQATMRARVTRRPDCPVCGAGDNDPPEPVTPLAHSSGDYFATILEALGMDGDEAEAMLPGPAARAIFCPDCGRYTELPHLLLRRRIRCGACGSERVLAAETMTAGTPVPLADAGGHTPAELGWPWWPIIEIQCGASHRFVELAGDAPGADEVVTIEPVTVGEQDAQ